MENDIVRERNISNVKDREWEWLTKIERNILREGDRDWLGSRAVARGNEWNSYREIGWDRECEVEEISEGRECVEIDRIEIQIDKSDERSRNIKKEWSGEIERGIDRDWDTEMDKSWSKSADSIDVWWIHIITSKYLQSDSKWKSKGTKYHLFSRSPHLN